MQEQPRDERRIVSNLTFGLIVEENASAESSILMAVVGTTLGAMTSERGVAQAVQDALEDTAGNAARLAAAIQAAMPKDATDWLLFFAAHPLPGHMGFLLRKVASRQDSSGSLSWEEAYAFTNRIASLCRQLHVRIGNALNI